MKKIKFLILTDHSHHSKENSVYAIVRNLADHPAVDIIDVASRANVMNNRFFNDYIGDTLYVTTASTTFSYDPSGSDIMNDLHKVKIKEYDIIWLRLPPPLDQKFLDYLDAHFNSTYIINNPKSIPIAGSKNFLLNFKQVCAPMMACTSFDEIEYLKKKFPIVLKPFNEYGGKGIVKIDGDRVWSGKEEMSYEDFKKRHKNDKIEYIGVKFLKNVSQGDKRIIVVNGKILGASLRKPAADSWMCNVSMGGSSNPSKIEPEEISIMQTINPSLSDMGIVIYGYDTLVGDDGKRVLSEINTTSIGGLAQMAQMENKPLVREAIDLILEDYQNKNFSHVGGY